MLTDVTYLVTENDMKKALKRLRLVMTARLINVAVKSGKPVLVKTHGKHTTVKYPKILNLGRFLETKNKRKEYDFHNLLYYKYNYNLR